MLMTRKEEDACFISTLPLNSSSDLFIIRFIFILLKATLKQMTLNVPPSLGGVA